MYYRASSQLLETIQLKAAFKPAGQGNWSLLTGEFEALQVHGKGSWGLLAPWESCVKRQQLPVPLKAQTEAKTEGSKAGPLSPQVYETPPPPSKGSP